jgi:hypothetical protein
MGATAMKRHALLGTGQGRLLWVGDDDDWALMRGGGARRPVLLCPQPSCRGRLHPVVSRLGRRFLRTAPGSLSAGCGHWASAVGATGPESAEHLWLKARLLAICRHLGWSCRAEDPVTRADVWLPDAATALEVQLRPTDLRGRTAARTAAGAARVVWFLAPHVPASRTVMAVPAVRFAVLDAGGRPATPWAGAGGSRARCRLVVFGPLWRWDRWRLVTTGMSIYRFLSGVLGGQVVWVPPATAGMPVGRGGWVGSADLERAVATQKSCAVSQDDPHSVRLTDALRRLPRSSGG